MGAAVLFTRENKEQNKRKTKSFQATLFRPIAKHSIKSASGDSDELAEAALSTNHH
jgi:hypothetical protein